MPSKSRKKTRCQTNDRTMLSGNASRPKSNPVTPLTRELLEEYCEAESEDDSASQDEDFDGVPNHSEGITSGDISTVTSSGEKESSSSPNWIAPNTAAAKTLPDGLSLRRSNLPHATVGVFAEKEIKKDTVFGPYVGVRTFDQQPINISGRLRKIFMNDRLHHYIVSNDPEHSNWMRYVNRSDSAEGRNLESYQHRYQIYFTAVVDIRKDTELLVCCCKDYNRDSLTSFERECRDLEQTTDAGARERNSVNGDKSRGDELTNKTGKIPAVEKRHKCETCSAAFTVKTSLIVHIKSHTGEKPFKCDTCQSRFTQRGYLTEHSRIHTGERPFKCDVCEAAFRTKKQKVLHSRIHTGEKPYKCDKCEARFTQLGGLKGHARIHTGERPFVCKVCGTAYSTCSSLRRHSKNHIGDKPHKCDVCKAGFIQFSNLVWHRRIHTKNRGVKRK